MIGVNAAGINSKLESLNAMLVKLKPQIWCVQETKLKENETLKCEAIKDFQVYYLYRQNSGGGGLALGIDKNIESTLMLQGDDETEVEDVLADVGGLLVRIVIGYGYQENSLKSSKDKFCGFLEAEVYKADFEGQILIIQLYSKLHGGPDLLKNDPKSAKSKRKIISKIF